VNERASFSVACSLLFRGRLSPVLYRGTEERSGFHQVRSATGPLQDRAERRAQRLTPIRQTVFDLGRHSRIDRAYDDAVCLSAAQLLAEHLLCDVRNACPRSEKRISFPPNGWNNMTRFHLPSRRWRAVSTSSAAAVGV